MPSMIDKATPGNCDREPIHIPGSIQPHGALLACEAATGVLLHASDNLARWLPAGTVPLAGRSIGDLIGAATLARLLQALGGAAPVRHALIDLPARPDDGQAVALECAVHVHDGICIAEFEPAPAVDQSRDWIQEFGDTIDALRRADDRDQLVERTVQQVKRLTQFDRVMVYRFDDDASGHVIADLHEPGMESFLDLHYPASDIPAQARELYRSNLVRYIADVAVEAVAVSRLPAGPPRPAPSGPAGPDSAQLRPLDMSHAMLRSASPIHLQYLRNMSVASTLTISLLVDDQLWGLIACHHRTATSLPIQMRRACYALAINLGFMVGWKEQQRRAAAIAAAHQAQGVIVDAFNRSHEPLHDVIGRSAAALLRITGATGGALWHGAAVLPFGQWPGGTGGDAVVRDARQAFEHAAEDLVYTERRALQPELNADEQRSACGVMAIRLDGAAASGIVWIRPECRREVAWGGDPDKPIEVGLDASGQPTLAPRASFARWQTLVQGRSRPWSDLDRAAARSLSTLGHVLTGRAALAEVSLNDQRARSLVALQSDAYWQIGLNGRLAALSKPLFAGQGSVQGMTPAELLAAYCDGATIAALERALGGKRPFRGLRVQGHNPANGWDFELLVSGEPMRDHDGRASGWHGTITDVTREVALQTSLQRRQVFLDRTGMVGGFGGWQVDLATRTVEWTEQCYKIHELECGHPVTMEGAMEFYAAEAQPLIRRAVADAIAGGRGWDLELPLVTARGRAIWVRVVAEVELDGGQPARIVGALQDITERRAMQSELQRSEQLLRDVLDAVVDEAFVLYDPDDRLVLCNEPFRAIFGSARDLIVPGITYGEILRTTAECDHYGTAVGRYEEFIAARTASHLAGTTDAIEQVADGRSMRVIERKLPDGHRVGFRFDVTRLVRATEAAEEASRAKGEFIATISHELRTPLQSIIGFSELGEHFAAGQPRFAEMFGDILAGGRRMLELVNDLLDLSKIYSTLDSPVLRRHDLAALVREVATELRPLASRRALRIKLPEPVRPLLADVDPARIQQVIRNVLANALRFAPDGSRIEISFDDHGAAGTEIGVRDHGPGIPPAELESIFAAFAQSTRTRDGSGGTGLGLTICRKIMSGHGGSIDAVNAAGGGALMRIRLPASAPGPGPRLVPGTARPPQCPPPQPANPSAQFCVPQQEIIR